MTRAVISSFVARDVAGAVALEWTTASEIGTRGLLPEALGRAEARYVAVNERLIPSLITSPQGGVYRYLDREACARASPIGTRSSRSRPRASGSPTDRTTWTRG